ncbi:BrnA antitoxin family protein [Tianweitania sp. BSSL-BM11]|uniref:BrnA antitoxin family protein n=2 Tax=Tianweitania aestuarii TaxID=2814886 RepID=A0ABS5RXK6_9HYPH|nr:BrnA antitoxin family protein [Tianweitania aestuarii]
MRKAGELYHSPDAPEGEDLGPEFWANAKIVHPPSKSVHLRLDQEVFDFFYAEADGKGHVTKMQNVLKAYAKAQSKA